MSEISIGTSGWHYPHWVGPFYPEGTRPEAFLRHYARRFSTVEINNTFYQLPTTATLRGWRDGTPEGFRFAVKASRYITHMKKLSEPVASSDRFFAAIAALGDKCGPVLFQLPGRWKVDAGRLEAFLEALPGGHRHVFELRDESWLVRPIFDLLERHRAALCIYDFAGRRSPARLTADFTYVRLHGPEEAAYRGRYDGRTLRGWARRIAGWRDAGIDVFGYFDNDEAGHAARDALRLKRMLEA